MLNARWIIARKEVVDCLRDVRSVVAALAYALMGPAVVFLVSLGESAGDKGGVIFPGMLSVFALVAAFVGGMNVAMDLVAGERERRSLVPLLLNGVSRRDVLIGKWLAVCLFALVGFVLCLAGSVPVLVRAGIEFAGNSPLVLAAGIVGLLPLPFLAASLQLWLSTACRSVKEAQTYLSLGVFLPMGVGMLGLFFPGAAQGWGWYAPVLGQQLVLEAAMQGGEAALLPAVVTGCSTSLLAALALYAAATRLRRDEIVYAS